MVSGIDFIIGAIDFIIGAIEFIGVIFGIDLIFDLIFE